MGREDAPLRDTTKLADAYEQQLLASTSKANLCCVSKADAAALAKELRKRGWKAKEEQGLKVIDYVRVNGRKKDRA